MAYDFGGGTAAPGPMTTYQVTATTTELEDKGAEINTTDKYVGKMIYNTTTGIVVFADGATPTSKWAEADGTDEHTPV